MNDKNKPILDDALSKLPNYEPEDQLWDKIEGGLEARKLQDALAKLPVYEPEDQVWAAIETNLPTQGTTIVRRLGRVAAIAASVAVLLVAGWYLMGQIRHTGETITYSEEVIKGTFSTAQFVALDDDEEAFEIIQILRERNDPITASPEFQSLEQDLNELNEAKQDLIPVIHDYEANPRLKIQLAKIERERSDVLKQIIKMI